MSLPQAPKDISSKPKAGAVTDPVNKRDKEADIDRKVRLFGVIAAFRDGRMPSNGQIDRALKYAIDNTPFSVDRLSPEGKRLVKDSSQILETARVIVKEKNADQVFQEFVWNTRDVDVASKGRKTDLPVGKQQAKQDGQKAANHLRTLMSLILTNSEVRKLLSDFAVIGRDVLAKGASEAAGKLRPTEDQLAKVDEPAPEGEFMSKEEYEQQKREAKEKAEAFKNGRYNHDERPVLNMAAGEADLIEDTPSSSEYSVEPATTTDVANSSDKPKTLMGKMKGLRNDLSAKIPQQHKEKANEHLDRGKDFIDDYFPQERREQYIYRLKKVIVECQKHDDYQESITWLLDTISQYFAHGQNVGKQHAKHTANAAQDDQSLTNAWGELRKLLERFANGQSMDVIFDAANRLAEDAKNDKALEAWLERANAYIRKTLLQPGFVLKDECNEEAADLRKTGQVFFEDKYKGHFDNFFQSIATFGRAMGEDPLNQRFGQDWTRLTKDLLFDSEGRLAFKSELWADIRHTILPAVVDKVGYVPIPRIEYTDDAFDLVIENLVLSGRNLFPNIIEVQANNYFKYSPYASIKDEGKHEFTLTFSQIQADLRDVAFYFSKKTGLPKISDSGLADIVLGGEGLKATVKVSNTPDKSSVLKVKDVKVKVDTLKFSIRDSKHDLLYKTLKPLVMGLVKKQIQKAVADAIRTGMEYVDGQLVRVRDRMDEAKASENETRVDALKGMMKSTKEEADAKSNATKRSSSQFKMPTSKRTSLLPDKGHATGIVNRTDKRESLVEKGERWRSEAFTIV
ncbi:hypothetical protein BD626DRAFT_429803 [Schizophyllum amplum]|uniref:Uncharacterized protein n=1 Tax=Schizophyllum amplum TaxID=97359 RepID=A0A550CHP1_9AGAR|nr:hypothetical protein BD626DRAFT_429803 [Auriculariopsis ampla]